MKRAFRVAKWQVAFCRVAKWQVASGKGDVRRCERSLHSPSSRRGGAALIVVLSLLGTLAFLGLLSYRFANQEFITSQNYALEPTATPTISGIPEFGLRQLIVGTPPSLEDSALYGSNYALVPNMIGRPNADERLSLADGSGTYADVNPYDGLGIGVWANATNITTLGNGQFIFDYDGDGVADADQDDFILNFSGAANPSGTPAAMTAFHPDAGYTYPDANSMFLAIDGYVRDPNTGTEYRVIIPSFHRPQYFPAKRGTDTGGGDAGLFGDIYEDSNTVNQVLRPHSDHVNADDNSYARFLTAATTAASGDTSRTIQPFPFRVNINADGSDNQAGVWSYPNATADPTDPSSTIYEYDVDCDGDGFRDAIWVDLDYPIVTLPDGRQFVPLYAFKVVDMDALLNVNAHGNMNGVLARDSTGTPISVGDPTSEYVSSSNQALSRSEVNVGLGLTADPVSGETDQHEQNFGLASSPTNALEISNYELLMLLNGRENYVENPPSVFNADSQLEGRWAEGDLIADFYNFTRGGSWMGAPAAGAYLTDDDSDDNSLVDDELNSPVSHPLGGTTYQDPDLHSLVWVPPFVHPLDFGGTGSGAIDNIGGAYGRRLQKLGTMTNQAALSVGSDNPAAFPTYFGAASDGRANLWQYQFLAPATEISDLNASTIDPTLFGNYPYHRAFQQPSVTVSGLQESDETYDFLLDDGGEVILSRLYRNPSYDSVFPTSEVDGLHLSQTDYDQIGISSRLRELAIINFDKTNTDLGALIRSRFTTDSWDRKEVNNGHSVSGTEARNWEFTEWTGAGDFATATGSVSFPPEFGSTVVPAGSALDPFRPELRQLLKAEEFYNDFLNPNSGATRSSQHPLNINRILSDDDPTAGTTAFDAAGNPQFRNLVPHPNLAAYELIDSGDTIPTVTVPEIVHDNSVGPALPFSDLNVDVISAASDAQRSALAAAQEWWARYDRQRLARDIYTLLYTIGYGNDALDLRTNTYPVLDNDSDGFNDYQEEIAQFAVNVVDALDRDDVITRFEYDEDLSDGWNPTGTAFKNGVEAQSLTISEALWIETLDAGSNDTETFWPDDAERQYIYIELRNNSPFDVKFHDDGWRLRRLDGAGTTEEAVVEFTSDPANVVKGGRTFLISGSDNSVLAGGLRRSSDFYVDLDGDAEFEAIVPWRVDDGDTSILPTDETAGHPDPLADIDLSYETATTPDHSLRYNATLPRGTGVLLDETTDVGVTEMTLVLERRRNMRDDGHSDNSSRWGDWVEVDRFDLEKTFFDPNPGAMTMEDHVGAEILSTARSEPLNWSSAAHENHTIDGADTTTGAAARAHSLGHPSGFDATLPAKDDPDDAGNMASKDRNQGNRPGNDPFTIWQPHFDRDFSSVFELLTVPVISPTDVTKKLVDTNTKKLTGWYDDSVSPPVPALAGARFMNVDPEDNSPTTITDDNRWYRLLEFVSVPDGGDDAIRERVEKLVRTPGKININTVRDESVLAAILDDVHLARFGGANLTDDTVDGTGRNWYRELTLARDGIDPLNEFGTGLTLPLPGVPGVPSDTSSSTIQYGAVPFRPLGYVPPTISGWSDAQNTNKTAHTLLRSHITDNSGSPVLNAPRLIALDQDLGLFEARPTTDVGTDAVDYHTRNRLLAKLANHTTNRSNVFAVWMTVKYFEAHQPDATNQPNVVQIGAELADSPTLRMFYVVDRTLLEDAVQVDDNGTPSDATDDIMTLNWRSFVVHQRTLPSN